jgi:hypothetical protein
MQGQSPQSKSMNSLAFEHYLRTGERLTTAQFVEKFEKKFNPNHDEIGRFTFGSGLGGGGIGAVHNSNSNKPTPSASSETWTDKLRSIFETKPAIRPVAPSVPRPRINQDMIAEIPEYPQTDKNSWRSSNDKTFIVAAAYYNHKYHLEPGDQGYRTPEFMKAWAMVESGGEDHQAAFQSDPFQVNKPKDWAPEKTRLLGLTEGQKMTPGVSALAALEWLRHKAAHTDGRGTILSYRSDRDALKLYNAHNVYTNQSGKVLHSALYANTILQKASQAVQPPK